MENKNLKRECQIAMVSENGGDQIGPGGTPLPKFIQVWEEKFGKRAKQESNRKLC